MEERFTRLIEQLREKEIDRRNFVIRATALGMSAGAISLGLSRAGAAAQDGTPAADGSPAAGDDLIGSPDVEHITGTDKGSLKFYSSFPMTGATTKTSGDMVEAIQMAIEDFGGAAGGYAIEYEALDDGIAANNGAWDAAKEAENATRVVNDPDAMVYIGTLNSGAAAVAIPILNEADPGPMAMISPANTVIGLTKENPGNEEGAPEKYYPTGKRNYMRVVPSDDLQGEAAAEWAYNENGSRAAYVLHDNQIYGEGVAVVFRDHFESLGGEILGFEAFDPDAPDYQALMTSIADTGPDILYLGAIVNLNASKLLQDMRGIMPADQVTFLGPDGLINQAFVDAAGEAAEGAYITFSGRNPDQLEGAGAAWYERMTERIGSSPDAYATYAYEAAVVAIQGVDKAQDKDRVKILDAMITTEGFEGLLGTWSFTETGDRDVATVSLTVVKDAVITFEKYLVE